MAMRYAFGGTISSVLSSRFPEQEWLLDLICTTKVPTFGMANQVAARLSGDDYQHLFGWHAALELVMPKRSVWRVTIEDSLAGSVDDVTVQHDVGTRIPDEFFQYKYHVDHRSEYSSQSLIEHEPGESSLLEKFWRTWQLLRGRDLQREIRLHLVSNWTWNANDKLKSCIDGRDNSLKEGLLTSSARSELGKIRKKWQEGLNADGDSFSAFIRCLRFRLGFDCSDELEKRVAERMENLGLRFDQTALLVAAGIVRNWIKDGRQELSKEDIERTLQEHDLILARDIEPGLTVYLTTIKLQKFDIAPDYVLDWREYFAGDPNAKGHELKKEADWNGALLPELHQLEARINLERSHRLIRARGLARLSAWFVFGFTFSEVARYTIEVDQNGRLWRTDAKASKDFALVTSDSELSEGETIDGEGKTVALGISITGSLEDDVRTYLSERDEKIAALLFLRPERELGRECLRDAGDAVALADGVKMRARQLVKKWGATKLLIFYFGPLSGACFIGHRFN
jgi:SMODS-associated and fused to various effectors sensor domain